MLTCTTKILLSASHHFSRALRYTVHAICHAPYGECPVAVSTPDPGTWPLAFGVCSALCCQPPGLAWAGPGRLLPWAQPRPLTELVPGEAALQEGRYPVGSAWGLTACDLLMLSSHFIPRKLWPSHNNMWYYDCTGLISQSCCGENGVQDALFLKLLA